jgi:transglutaminase/protease-like cytokinesis protein 3
MKQWLTIFFGAITLNTFSQKTAVDFPTIDVQSIKTASPAELTKQLVAFCNTDLEKVRAIFKWVADNIDYKTKQPINRKAIPIINEADDNLPLKSLDERVAEMVLQRGFAVCDGYARLFKTLCSYAGIHSEIITGYGRVSKSPRRFGNNHTWNAVLIDNKWQLLDVTWASGFISWAGDNFIRRFDEEYFLASPAKFILEHYPDDLAWSLMEEPPLLSEFRSSPFKQRTFSKYKITTYKPASGIIEVNEGDTLQIELETFNADNDKTIGADPFLDMALFSTSSSALLSPSSVNRNRFIYNYCVTSPAVEWLYIQYNNDVIMRYRLVVKNNNSAKGIATR